MGKKQTIREEIKKILMKWNNACGDAEVDQILSLFLKSLPKDPERCIIKNPNRGCVCIDGWKACKDEIKKRWK